MNKLIVSSSVLLAHVLCPTVSAETTTDNSIIVTATRTSQSEDETLASVSVITREDIERSQAQSVQELLSGINGISITNNGGLGKATSVFMRGTESDHLLVMINGIKVGSATSGDTAFQNIPVSMIERIEIVRGPRSSLYGAEALGGVIQIFTRQGKGDLSPSFSSTRGSYRTSKNTLGLSYGDEQGWYSITLSSLDSDGFSSTYLIPLFPAGFTTEPDNDSYYEKAASINAGYRFSKTASLEVHAMVSEGESMYDGTFQNETSSHNQVVGVSYQFMPATSWQMKISTGESRDYSDNFLNGVYSSTFNTRRSTAALQNDISISDKQLLTVGIDYLEDEVETSAYPADPRSNKALFTQYQAETGNQDIKLSARIDDNEQFGEHTTGSISWGYRFDKTRLTMSYGTAFKAPSFNELYFPFYGNLSLEPESSATVEAGLKGKYDNGNWSLNIYQTDVTDLIAYDSTIFAANNIDDVVIRGMELGSTYSKDNWKFSTNISLMQAENRSAGANYGNTLPRRATESLRFDADREFARWQLGATLNAVGKRYDDLANTVELDAYTTVDLRTTYRINEALKIQASIKNATDEKYETAKYYNQPERSFYLTFSYQPQ